MGRASIRLWQALIGYIGPAWMCDGCLEQVPKWAPEAHRGALPSCVVPLTENSAGHPLRFRAYACLAGGGGGLRL